MNLSDLKSLIKATIFEGDNSPTSEDLAQIRAAFENISPPTITLNRAPVKAVRKVRQANDEYVYDIGMKNQSQPWFFGNNILIHNSCYFSAYQTLKSEIDSGKLPWDKDKVVQLYNGIGEAVNDSFPDFMARAFHCPHNRGAVIKAGREIVGTKGYFISKKRYAILYYDKDNKRVDSPTKIGKLKAMGLDMKRADTPEYMQNFLEEVLMKILTNHGEDEVSTMIKEFRQKFNDLAPWEKGSPKRVNNLAKYRAIAADYNDSVFTDAKDGNATIPGHVRASLNWNTLRKMNSDRYSMEIMDGMKVIVCKLKPNPMGFTSVAYPTDERHLPTWFQALPFDGSEMEVTIIDKKLENLIGVLGWDWQTTAEDDAFSSMFTFE